jgi:hypothetical protein
MRIPKDALFNILTLQTISNEGNVVAMFNPRGEPTYVIEVVGSPSQLSLTFRPLDQQQRRC